LKSVRLGATFPFTNRATVLALAQAYWRSDVISSREAAIERLLEAELPKHREHGYLGRSIFLTICSWKSPRPRRFYEMNSTYRIRSRTAAAFEAKSEGEAISLLANGADWLLGVRLRVASALMHWLKPEQYPILDFRVVAALGENPPESWEDLAFYGRIAEKCRRLAARLDVDLRTLDRAMWAWQKLKSRGITSLVLDQPSS
jgi:hypothetical protein